MKCILGIIISNIDIKASNRSYKNEISIICASFNNQKGLSINKISVICTGFNYKRGPSALHYSSILL